MSKTNLLRITLCLLAGLFLSSCEQAAESPAEVTQTPEEELQVAEIQWYGGSIEEAFSLAASEQKPLFFYWGAVWCPPCEQIKATVFKHPAFLAKTQLFMPVYLDGDTERAQSWGEHYAVAGYPTMIVFTPTGDEITRIPGWIDSTQYLNVLQLALDDPTSTADLLRQAMENPADIDADAYTRLAFYSWGQSNLPEDLVIDAVTYSTLASAARDAGNAIAWSRLVFHSLYAAVEAMEDEGLSLADDEKQQARDDLNTIFSNKELVVSNSDYLMFYFSDLTALLKQEGSEPDALAANWIAALKFIREAPQLPGAEHIASWYPEIEYFLLNNPDATQLPAVLEADIISAVNQIDNETRGEARQAVINTAYQVFEEAHRVDLARELLLTELEKSHAPYYFMSSLGDLEEKAGNTDAAVEWHRRAYEGSDGEATRFQWGYQYVDSLVRLVPEQSDVIVTISRGLLQEFENQENIFTGRNFGRLEMLLDSLEEWQESVDSENQEFAVLSEFYSTLENLCSETSLDNEGKTHCQDLLLAEF